VQTEEEKEEEVHDLKDAVDELQEENGQLKAAMSNLKGNLKIYDVDKVTNSCNFLIA